MNLFYAMGEFLELAIPGAILIGILYGCWKLIKMLLIRLKDEFPGNDGCFTYEGKKNLLNMIKILVGAQMIGFLFYVTPAINENVKIIVSLTITIGGFIGTFFIKEKKGYNGVCRTLIFIGQEFFGITMFLMMVNKGMSYSINSIFGIWSVFNFYISKQFRKIENKIFFWVTLIIFIFSMIGTYANTIETYILIIGICLSLLGIYCFGSKEKFSTRLIENATLTILIFTVMFAVLSSVDRLEIIFGTVIVYIVAIIATLIAIKNFNSKALFVYLPYVVMLFLVEWEIDMLWLLSIFNVLLVVWLLSDKSLYKKLLCVLVLLCTIPLVVVWSNIDELTTFIIYTSSIIFTYTYLFAPTKSPSLEEGGEENE